ncbi:hypothetical protein [Streptomyces sp. AS02]|uniref:hypothetical protein n=1 Tax=Streptomyces sp. AS02 TaxID=2938946 RepID=UPI0020210C86|nr:hypothetical protein [Streptomyces sp. AS02]MCL8009855.1 hypothetical protein [Streptomyces sp. AS02]
MRTLIGALTLTPAAFGVVAASPLLAPFSDRADAEVRRPVARLHDDGRHLRPLESGPHRLRRLVQAAAAPTTPAACGSRTRGWTPHRAATTPDSPGNQAC